MTEQTAQAEAAKLSKDELLDIAARKLRERQVNVVRRLEPQVTTYKEVPRVSQLLGAHYEKLRAGLEGGSKVRAVVDGLERLVYDGAKVAEAATWIGDFVVGGLLLREASRNVLPLRPLRTAQHGWAVAETLGAIGVWRYAPVTMVARTALNVTL